MSVGTQEMSLTVPIFFFGDYQAPDRFKGILAANLVLFIIEKEIISIDDTVYTRNPDVDEWEIIATEHVFFIGPDVFVGIDTSILENFALVGVETVDETAVYHLKGTAMSGTFDGIYNDFDLSFYIRVDDGFLAQVQAEGELDLGENDPFFGGIATGKAVVSINLRLSDFGKSVSIPAIQLESAPSSPTSLGANGVIKTLRQLSLDYWTAINSYDANKALSYLEESYRMERESSIRADIGQIETFNVKLRVSEESPPQITSPSEGEMYLRINEPLGTRRVHMAFIKLDDEWKIAHAHEVD